MRNWFPACAALAGLAISVVSPVGPQAAARPPAPFDAGAEGAPPALLKNERRTLPLSRSARRIHVAGRGAAQILAGLRAAVPSPSQVTYAADGRSATGADVGVVVVGDGPDEPDDGPFAGRAGLAPTAEERDAIANLKRAAIPVVLVVVSRRPLALGDMADTADAIVVGRPPGADGRLIADALFGHLPPSVDALHAYGRAFDD
jgi:beta-glucosidase